MLLPCMGKSFISLTPEVESGHFPSLSSPVILRSDSFFRGVSTVRDIRNGFSAPLKACFAARQKAV